jgi:hypothetical protein
MHKLVAIDCPSARGWHNAQALTLRYACLSCVNDRLCNAGAECSRGETVTDILVIDDNDEFRDTLRAIPEGGGYTVHEARDVRQPSGSHSASPEARDLTVRTFGECWNTTMLSPGRSAPVVKTA